jgi:asparagine synthase (glutamine-hydrolysing)
LPRMLAPLNPAEHQIAFVSPWLARMHRFFKAPPQLVESFGRAIGLLHSVLASNAMSGLNYTDPYRTFFSRFRWRDQLLGRAAPHQILYMWFRSIFVTYHLAADRLDMGHAVEVRYPFLDHVLFEALHDVPIAVMGYDDVQKYLLRAAAQAWLPESIANMDKQPFYAPPTTLRPGNRFLMLVQDTLRGPALARLPIFDREAVVALLDGMKDLPELEQTMLDPLLLMMTSMCLIGEAYRL